MEKGWGLEKGSPELGLRKGLPGIEWTKPLFWAAKLEARSEGTIREKGERKGIEMREQGKKKGVGKGCGLEKWGPFHLFCLLLFPFHFAFRLCPRGKEEKRPVNLLFQLLFIVPAPPPKKIDWLCSQLICGIEAFTFPCTRLNNACYIIQGRESHSLIQRITLLSYW